MPNTIRHEIPVRDYGIRIYIKPLDAIDLSVVCDESDIGNKAREHADDIIASVVEQVKKQLEGISDSILKGSSLFDNSLKE